MFQFDTLLHDFWMSKKIVTDQISYLNELSSSFHVMASSCIKSNKAHEHPPHKLDNFPLPHYIDIINPLITQFSNMAQKIGSQASEAETQRKFLAELVRPAVKNYDQLKSHLVKALKSKSNGDQVSVARNALEKFEEKSQSTVENAFSKMKWLSRNIANEISQIMEMGIVNQYAQFNEENNKFRLVLKVDDKKEDKEQVTEKEVEKPMDEILVNLVVAEDVENMEIVDNVEIIEDVEPENKEPEKQDEKQPSKDEECIEIDNSNE